jgi:cytidylate kinase
MNEKSSSERLAEVMERTRLQWQARRRAEAELSAPLIIAPSAFSIAISREAGTHGTAIAHAVGKCLDWPVYDRELLQLVAADMGLRTSLLERVDEKRPDRLHEFFGTFTSARAVSDSAYVQHLFGVLLSLAAHGDCVLVGRGAAQVLPPATTLRVRLIAPKEDRVEAIRLRFGIDHREALRWVEKTDLERTRFVEDHFCKDPNDTHLYDLVLNSLRFSVQECAELIVEALHRRHAHVPRRHLSPAAAN